MFNKKDPLINSVKKIMEENELRRQAELDLNEELGIASKRALPHEHHANYDALLEQKIAEALHPNQQKLDVHEPEKDKLTSQDFKLLRAKKGIKEAIGDKEGTAGTLRKNGKPFVPDTLANSPFMQASPDKAPMPPERPKDLDKQAPTPPARPKDLNENHVLYTHPKADIKVVRKGEGSKEGAAIEVHKGGKKVASGDYDHGADAFFVNVGGKGQKSFDTAKDIANHFHGLSEQFQQIDEMAPKGAKYERMVKHIKDKYSKDGKLSDKEKSIAYATAWKAKNKNMEEGLTAEQVMAEIRKNLGEAKMKKIEEGGDIPPNSISSLYTPKEKIDKNVPTGDGPTPSQPEIDNPKAPGSSPAQPPATTAQSGQMPVKGNPEATPKPLPVIKNQDTGAPGQDPGDRGSSLSKPATTTGSGMKTQGSGAPGQDPGDRGSSAPSKLPTFASGAPGTPKITPTPNVDKNVPTGDAPAAGAAALTKQTPKPAPSAAKPTAPKPTTPTAKDDIWNDSMIRRTGEGGTETADDFNRNQDLYKQRMAAGGQRPAPSSAPSSPAKPTATKPTTPTAPTGSSTMRDAAMSDRGGGGTSSTSQNGGSAMPSGAGGNAALRAAKRDGDGTTSDTFNRFQSNKPGTTSDTFNRLQSNKPGGTYTRASQTPSNEVGSGSPANDTVGTSPNQNRTPAKDMLARPTKPPTSALNTRNNTSVAESFKDTIMKVLKG